MRWLATAVLFVGLLGAAAAQDVEKELKKLEGDYKVKALAKGGMDAPAQFMSAVKGVTIKGGKFIIKIMDEENTATIKIDPTKTPAHIDFIPEDGPVKDKRLSGLYKFEKGELTIVLAEGSERPKDFKADGEKTMKMILTRKEKDK